MSAKRRYIPSIIAGILSLLVLFVLPLPLDWIAKGLLVLIIFGAVYGIAARLGRKAEDSDSPESDS
ncbi:MAG: hypothetical protein AAFV07_02380 [Bacteroidota bacterium]